MGDLRARELTQDHVDDFAVWMLDQKPAKRHTANYSPSTVSKSLRMLRACLKDCAARRYIDIAPDFRIEVTEAGPRKEYLTQAEVRRMLDRCNVASEELNEDGKVKVTYRARDRRHLEGFIMLAVTTAARREAILDLRWRQVNLNADDDGGILDWGTGKVSGHHFIDFGSAVGNKRRPTIPISQNPDLVKWLMLGRDAYDEDGNAVGRDPDSHVITYQGKPVKDLKKGLKELAKEAGVTKKIAPAHTFKHTAITWMVQAGVPISSIADLTNTSERMLRRVYGHHIPDYREELSLVSFE